MMAEQPEEILEDSRVFTLSELAELGFEEVDKDGDGQASMSFLDTAERSTILMESDSDSRMEAERSRMMGGGENEVTLLVGETFPDSGDKRNNEEGRSLVYQADSSSSPSTINDPKSSVAEDYATTSLKQERGSRSETGNEEVMEDDEEEEVACGFLVDRINTLPYQKAIERGEVPFCAFAPISTSDMFLLKLQDCSDNTRHMLVPALKEDVFSTPGALKAMSEDQEPGNEESMNYRVAIVAIARQVYSEEQKQLVVNVDPLLKRDKTKIETVKFLTLDMFADFAFLGFDGNVSEFSNKGESNNKDNGKTSDPNQLKEQRVQNAGPKSPPPTMPKEKSPPKAPVRRGRGGRRRMSRKSPPMPSTSTAAAAKRNQRRQQQPQHPLTMPMPPPPPAMYQNCYQALPTFALPHDMHSEFTPTFIKVEPGAGQTPQYFTQVPIQLQHNMSQMTQLGPMADPRMFSQEGFATVPMEMSSQMEADIPVPMPFNEVTVSTSDLGSDNGVQQTNHDILTIAFDQLVSMTGGAAFPGGSDGQGDKKEGRRPGRKPRRKPLKDRNPDDPIPLGQLSLNGEHVPKRRGRPPKNRQPIIITGQENENLNSNSAVDCEEFEKYSRSFNFQQMPMPPPPPQPQDENFQNMKLF